MFVYTIEHRAVKSIILLLHKRVFELSEIIKTKDCYKRTIVFSSSYLRQRFIRARDSNPSIVNSMINIL